MTLKDLWDRVIGSVGKTGTEAPLYRTVRQEPRYDLIDAAGQNQHFHLLDREGEMDWAIDHEREVHPQHLCRKHFASQERLTGYLALADCQEGGYRVVVDNECHWGCDICRAEMHAFTRLASEALQEHPYPG